MHCACARSHSRGFVMQVSLESSFDFYFISVLNSIPAFYCCASYVQLSQTNKEFHRTSEIPIPSALLQYPQRVFLKYIEFPNGEKEANWQTKPFSNLT